MVEKEKMSAGDYNKYKSAIEIANNIKDKDALRRIQMELIARYGLDNEDVKYLLKLFRYNV